MKPIHRTWHSLLSDLLAIVCVMGVIGVALKFLFFQIVLNLKLYGDVLSEVIFPFFPNVLDSAFLIFAACWLAIRKKRKAKP